jgi:hypothetical protein
MSLALTPYRPGSTHAGLGCSGLNASDIPSGSRRRVLGIMAR